jgi:CNT family concentrative nucleoside transporter
MTAGMGTIAGTVMVLYATFLQGIIPDPAGHLLTASLMSMPAAVVVARLMIPDDARTGSRDLPFGKPYAGTMDAIAHGTQDGVQLLIGILAMLVTLIALISLANMVLGLFPDLGGAPLTLQRMLSWLMTPIVWLIGIPWAEAQTAGQLMGIKTVLNELLAYLEMSKLPAGALSDRSRLLMTYALCGFANFGSLGILIAGLSAMAPDRRSEVVGLGMKSIVSGTLTTLLTAAVAGAVL